MKEYHKLVRDRIPDIIRQDGETPHIRVLEDEEYRHHLEMKLDEEVKEFHTDKNVEELADILEVVYALADLTGSREALLSAYQQKHKERGGFKGRIYLVSKE